MQPRTESFCLGIVLSLAGILLLDILVSVPSILNDFLPREEVADKTVVGTQSPSGLRAVAITPAAVVVYATDGARLGRMDDARIRCWSPEEDVLLLERTDEAGGLSLLDCIRPDSIEEGTRIDWQQDAWFSDSGRYLILSRGANVQRRLEMADVLPGRAVRLSAALGDDAP
ncbi:MAG: hypothetical protein ACOCX4_03380 [Planctomycetota bacterium]